MKPYRPINSYRFGLSKHFDFFALTKASAFVKKLGIDLVYTSPYFKVVEGSNNPYEIVSPELIDEKYGGLKGFLHFVKKMKQLNLGHMIDIVANHMASSEENPWFYDVLKNGKKSPYFSFFSFRFVRENERIVLPYLSKSLDEAIEQKLVYFDKKSNSLRVNDRKLPVSAGSHKLELKKLIEAQHYELMDAQYYNLIDYHDANKLVNFRRFFDIHELIGLNMHLPQVFKAYHKQISRWFDQGYIQGFRVDHPDGLLDPSAYFQNLKKMAKGAYIIAEKILQPYEDLPKQWKIEGSVGYDFLNALNQLFVDGTHEKAFSVIYKKFSGTKKSPQELLVDLKKCYVKKYLAAELCYFSKKIYEKLPFKSSIKELKEALISFLGHVEVYRSYVTQTGRVLKIDHILFEKAAQSLKPPYKNFFLKDFLTKPFRSILTELQQVLPAIFAKGFEDTFLYRYLRLTSLNEVGSSPVNFGMSQSEFLKICQKKIRQEPYTLTTSSTHDTKRSEDVRQRINALSQMPNVFEKWLREAREMHAPVRKKLAGIDSAFEYLFYQTLLGIWPQKTVTKKKIQLICSRMVAYCIKASREAKKSTDWVNINHEYEDKITRFIKSVLVSSSSARFYKHIQELIQRLAPISDKGSISSLLIRLTVCGVFDLYQGQELFKFDLVDPDNRRAVNFKKSQEILSKVCLDMSKTKNADALLKRWYLNLTNNKFRVWMLRTLLHFRQEHPELMMNGALKPLKVIGQQSSSVFAYFKLHKGHALFVITPIFLCKLKKQGVYVQFPFSIKGEDLLSGQEITIHKGEKVLFTDLSISKVIYAKVKTL